MRNNILGGLVVFFVVVACLLLIDDISSQKENTPEFSNTELIEHQNHTDLTVIETED